jgi:hypothetical protein
METRIRQFKEPNMLEYQLNKKLSENSIEDSDIKWLSI